MPIFETTVSYKVTGEFTTTAGKEILRADADKAARKAFPEWAKTVQTTGAVEITPKKLKAVKTVEVTEKKQKKNADSKDLVKAKQPKKEVKAAAKPATPAKKASAKKTVAKTPKKKAA